MAGVFISYRRSDSSGHTGRLADDLSEGLEDQQLFRDIEAIEAGEDFVEALNRAVGACSVMLVIIGPTWAKVQTADGKRRLHQEGDFVRIEIETALSRGVRVIPVLVGDAQMPQAEDLPESMLPLLRRNAYSISDRRWQYDIDQLLDILAKTPGIASRKHAQHNVPAPTVVTPPPAAVTPPPAVVAPQSREGLPTWIKVALGSGVTILVIFALVMMSSDPPSSATAAAGSAGNSASLAQPSATDTGRQTGFAGVWRSDENLYFSIEPEGEALSVVSGDSIDPANAQQDAANAAAPPTKAGQLLIGKAAAQGQSLEVTLTDAFSNDTETLRLTLATDGQTLEGDVTAGADGQPARIVLRRL